MTDVAVSMTDLWYYVSTAELVGFSSLSVYQGEPRGHLAGVWHGKDSVTLVHYARSSPRGRLVGEIPALVMQDLRQRYGQVQGTQADPLGLMPKTFTVAQLRKLHEVIHGHKLPKDSFRRWVIDQLVPYAPPTSGGLPGRPAELFTLKETS